MRRDQRGREEGKKGMVEKGPGEREEGKKGVVEKGPGEREGEGVREQRRTRISTG